MRRCPRELNVSQYGTYTVKLKANGDLVGQRSFSLLPAVPPCRGRRAWEIQGATLTLLRHVTSLR
jgi:hypothetical protein